MTICNTIEETLVDAQTVIDALIIVTEWNEFRSPNFSMIKKAMADPVIFDGRNLYDPKQLSELGISYYSIGRPLLTHKLSGFFQKPCKGKHLYCIYIQYYERLKIFNETTAGMP